MKWQSVKVDSLFVSFLRGTIRFSKSLLSFLGCLDYKYVVPLVNGTCFGFQFFLDKPIHNFCFLTDTCHNSKVIFYAKRIFSNILPDFLLTTKNALKVPVIYDCFEGAPVIYFDLDGIKQNACVELDDDHTDL